jgi:hypothetical protein
VALAGSLGVVLTLAVWGAVPAAAGGHVAGTAPRGPDRQVPDVAVVVAGGTGRTTVVRSGEPGFDRLWALLQPTYTGTERVAEGWTEGRFPPVRMTVMWGLTGVGGWPQTDSAPGGDVAMERQDQLFVAGDGTPWVRTDPAPEVGDDDIRWHRASRSAFGEVSREGPPAEGLPAQESEGATADAAGGSAGGWAKGGAWPLVAGLAVGCAAGAGGTLLIRRAAARPGAGPPREQPRQELIDL